MQKVHITIADAPMKYTGIEWELCKNGIYEVLKHFHDKAHSTEGCELYSERTYPRTVIMVGALLEGDVPKLRTSIQEVLKDNDINLSVAVRSQDINKVHIVTAEKNEPWLKFIGAE